MLKERVRFRQYYVVLPLTWTAPGADRKHPEWLSLNDHPGDWEVTWIHGANALRTWRFKVNGDGTIAQHPEQESMSLPAGVWFIEQAIPAGGSPADARLAPDAAKRGRLFMPWATDAGQALAGTVPRKGAPAP